MLKTFAFVAADEHGKARKSDAALVRSHCMRGKNKRADSRRSKRLAKQMGLIAPVHIHESKSEADGTGRFHLLPPPVSALDLVHFAGAVDDFSKRTLFKC